MKECESCKLRPICKYKEEYTAIFDNIDELMNRQIYSIKSLFVAELLCKYYLDEES